jgi:hypothetical protein
VVTILILPNGKLVTEVHRNENSSFVDVHHCSSLSLFA